MGLLGENGKLNLGKQQGGSPRVAEESMSVSVHVRLLAQRSPG
jgi:hypothetical protein